MTNDNAHDPHAELGAETFLSATDLRTYVSRHRRAEHDDELAQRQKAAAARRQLIDRLSQRIEITDALIADCTQRIREAAEAGKSEILMLRFPSDMCTDRGRAINNQEPGWERTLIGVPRQVVEFWEEQLRPRGFHCRARILDYPDGMPGDVGMFYAWD